MRESCNNSQWKCSPPKYDHKVHVRGTQLVNQKSPPNFSPTNFFYVHIVHNKIKIFLRSRNKILGRENQNPTSLGKHAKNRLQKANFGRLVLSTFHAFGAVHLIFPVTKPFWVTIHPGSGPKIAKTLVHFWWVPPVPDQKPTKKGLTFSHIFDTHKNRLLRQMTVKTHTWGYRRLYEVLRDIFNIYCNPPDLARGVYPPGIFRVGVGFQIWNFEVFHIYSLSSFTLLCPPCAHVERCMSQL